MNLVERAKKIITEPKNEWLVIEQESTSVASLITSYLIPLALIGAIASFIGYGLIGINIPFVGTFGSIDWGIKYALISLVTTVVGALLSAFVIDMLAPNFGSVKNFEKAFQLVVFAYTPAMVAGIFNIYPALSALALLASIYGLYVLYLGIAPMMKTPQEKVTTYFVISLLVTIVVYFVLSTILTGIFIGSAFATGMY